MKKIENLKIQIRVSYTMALIGFAVVLVNIFRNLYFRDIPLIDIIRYNHPILVVFLFSLLMFLSRKSKRTYVQYLQIVVFLANATLALLDEYDAFHGMGFIILAILLAYRYGMFEKHTRLKLIILAVFTLCVLEFSIHLSGDDQIGSSVDIIIYLVFFLSIIYLIYMSEIKNFLRVEKDYLKTVSSMETEKARLIQDIVNHTGEIQKKESRIKELEIQISNISLNHESINLKKDYQITNREEDVIREFCQNPHLTTKELAYKMNMSLGTIKQHFSSIFKKLHVRSRSELLDKCKWTFHS